MDGISTEGDCGSSYVTRLIKMTFSLAIKKQLKRVIIFQNYLLLAS